MVYLLSPIISATAVLPTEECPCKSRLCSMATGTKGNAWVGNYPVVKGMSIKMIMVVTDRLLSGCHVSEVSEYG